MQLDSSEIRQAVFYLGVDLFYFTFVFSRAAESLEFKRRIKTNACSGTHAADFVARKLVDPYF